MTQYKKIECFFAKRRFSVPSIGLCHLISNSHPGQCSGGYPAFVREMKAESFGSNGRASSHSACYDNPGVA
jgi:hypothetical protein